MKWISKLLISVLLPVLAWAEHPAANHVWEQAAYGDIPGITLVELIGTNAAITTTFEPIWAESAAYTVRTAAMTTPVICSTSANDAAAGTGARTATVTGVNTSYAAFSESKTLNGVTAVALTTSNVLFINDIVVATVGSGGVNAGIIRVGTTACDGSGVPTVATDAHVPVGHNKSQSFMRAVPDNYSLLCRNITVGSYDATISRTAQFVLDKYVDPVSAKVLLRDFLPAMVDTQAPTATYPGVIKFAEKTIVVLQALSAASTGPIMARAECLLISDTWAATAQDLF